MFKGLLLISFFIAYFFGNATAQTTTPVVSKVVPVEYVNIAKLPKGFQFVMSTNIDKETLRDFSEIYEVEDLLPPHRLHPRIAVHNHEIVGKIFTVEKIETYTNKDGLFTSVWMRCNSKIYCYNYIGDMEDFSKSREVIPFLVPYKDMELAKKNLVGKTFSIEISNWMKTTEDGFEELYENYNGDKETVKVTDIGFGKASYATIRIFFKNKADKTFFIDVIISRTNSTAYVFEGETPNEFIDTLLNIGSKE